MSKKEYPCNFSLSDIPKRTLKLRNYGITMVMDKGLSVTDVESLCSQASPFIDFVKLGFGTSYISQDIELKIRLYQSAGIHVFLGGTLFEACAVRNQLDTFYSMMNKWKLEHVEISDGTLPLSKKEKVDYIQDAIKKGFIVLSEVGSKKKGFQMFPYKWVAQIKNELAAGSSYVITESRESGNVGIYRLSGKARNPLINKITSKLPVEKIIFEAPKKNQQHFFIDKVGCNVNLGNIAPSEIIALETMRVGLRSDTFYKYL